MFSLFNENSVSGESFRQKPYLFSSPKANPAERRGLLNILKLIRSFIEVCKCAGWGDVGYVNRWTMEITNNSSRYHIPLVVGRRIAQIVFFETGPILASDYAKEGKYQTSDELEVIKASWVPEMLLPRLHKDRDIKK